MIIIIQTNACRLEGNRYYIVAYSIERHSSTVATLHTGVVNGCPV